MSPCRIGADSGKHSRVPVTAAEAGQSITKEGGAGLTEIAVPSRAGVVVGAAAQGHGLVLLLAQLDLDLIHRLDPQLGS